MSGLKQGRGRDIHRKMDITLRSSDEIMIASYASAYGWLTSLQEYRSITQFMTTSKTEAAASRDSVMQLVSRVRLSAILLH